MDLRTFLRVLRRHSVLLLGSIVGVTLVAVVVASSRPDTYTAWATLRARTTGAITDGTVRTDSVEYLDRLRSTYADLVDEPSFRRALAGPLLVEAAPDPFVDISSDSELFDVGVEAGEPDLAVAGANAAAELLIATVRTQDEEDLRRGEAQFLAEQERLRQEIDQIQGQLTNLGAAPDEDTEAEQEVGQLRAELDVRLEAAAQHSAEYATWRRQQIDRARSLSIVSPASAAERTGPGTATIAAAGLLAGLIAGLGVALVAENLSDEVDVPGPAAALLGAPLLGALAPGGRARAKSTTTATTPNGLETAALRLVGPRSGDVWLVVPNSEAGGRAAALGLAGTMARLGRRAAVLLSGGEATTQPGATDLADVMSGPGPTSSELVASHASEGEATVFVLRHTRFGGTPTVTPPVVDKAIIRMQERHDLVVVGAPSFESGAEWAVYASVVPRVVIALEGDRASRARLVSLREQVEDMGGRVAGVLHVSPRGSK